MRISHLRSLLAVHDFGGISAATGVINLSQSAISIQMKQLEDDFGFDLFLHGKRPATLTARGIDVVKQARVIIEQVDNLKNIARADSTTGTIKIGFVPTTLQTILPAVLSQLHIEFPDLTVSIRSDLSNELAQAVEQQDLDFAFLTASTNLSPNMTLTEIGKEPLFVIHNQKAAQFKSDLSVLRAMPYIAFNRKTSLGMQIETQLVRRGFLVNPPIELDSIDAIENLVALGHGASIVPRRILATPLSDRLQCIAFQGEFTSRKLILASSKQTGRDTIKTAITRSVRQCPR